MGRASHLDAQVELKGDQKNICRSLLQRSIDEHKPILRYECTTTDPVIYQWYLGHSVHRENLYPVVIGSWLLQHEYIREGMQDPTSKRKLFYGASGAGRRWLASFPKNGQVVAVETPPAKGRYKCPDCNAAFATQNALGSHSKKHLNEKKALGIPTGKPTPVPPIAPDIFKCPECGAEFDKANKLGSHRSARHGIKGVWKRTESSAPPATNGHTLALKPPEIVFVDETPEEIPRGDIVVIPKAVATPAEGRETRIIRLLAPLPDSAVEAILEYGIMSYQDDLKKKTDKLMKEIAETSLMMDSLTMVLKEGK